MPQVPRLIGSLDRDPQSVTYGCLDRRHWAWKFADFPLTMAQAGVYPMALAWAHEMPGNTYHQNARFLTWIEAAIRYTLRRQHRNGSFDSVGPWTQDHGVTLAMVYILAEAIALVRSGVSDALVEDVQDAVRGACRFALESSEDYAFINNHQALFALAFQNACSLTGDRRYARSAEELITEITSRQSEDGWYSEYGGPDAGYESLGIFYLAMYWRRHGGEQLLSSLRRAVEFYSYCMHPDGSVGGAYGSRQTSLYFPAGFEVLRREIPLAGSIAEFMSSRIGLRNVVTPETTDPENLSVITYTYFESCLAAGESGDEGNLPCISLRGVRHFPDSGLTCVGTDRYYAVANARKSGICRVFERAGSAVAYEDAGYFLSVKGVRFSSQYPADVAFESCDGGWSLTSTGVVTEVNAEQITPVKFLALRVLNLTAFRSRRLGALVRRLVIRRLITARRRGPVRIRRSFAFAADQIRVEDSLQMARRTPIDELQLTRDSLAMHMGSSKYFHSSQLREIQMPELAAAIRSLASVGEAKLAFVISFEDADTHQLRATTATNPSMTSSR
jgi:hypothetical protein